MEKHEIERSLLESVAHLTTWEDAYKWFDEQAQASVRYLHPSIVFGAMFLLYSFIQAMRELPDEGDIQVLLRRMVHIQAYDLYSKFSLDAPTAAYDMPEPTPEQRGLADTVYGTLMASLRKQAG